MRSRRAREGVLPAKKGHPTRDSRRREAYDAILRAAGYRFAECACGTRLKVPRPYNAPTIACPSCGRAVAIASPGKVAVPTEPLRVRLQLGGWQTVECSCGLSVNISPGFVGTRIRCRRCGRRIEIER